MFKFENDLKGHITESVIRILLEDAGYSVTPYGIEFVIPSVRAMRSALYKNVLKRAVNVRFMPDLFVIDGEQEKSWCLEVKYRNSLNDAVLQKLTKDITIKYKNWKPFYLLLAVNDIPSAWQGTEAIITNIRLFEIAEGTQITPKFFLDRKNMKRIQDVFERLKKRFDEKTISKAQSVLKAVGDALKGKHDFAQTS